MNEKMVSIENAVDDLGEWRDSLKQGLEEGKSNSQITWAGQKITDLAKRDLAKLVKLISADGEINPKDKKDIEELIAETKELLFSLRKES